MKISELAKRAEVNVQTIRFYEREGLLREPERNSSGYRSYEERDLERVSFIRICQSLGFTLREIQELIKLHQIMSSQKSAASLRPSALEAMLKLASERISSMEDKIRALSKMRSDLLGVMSALRTSNPSVCPASASEKPAKK